MSMNEHQPRRKRQIEKTKEAFSTALLYLLARQPLDSLTVTALVSASGMSRKSFYRHYSSLADVLVDDAVRLTVRMSQSLSTPGTLSISRLCGSIITFWTPHTDVLIALRDAHLMAQFHREWDRYALTSIQPPLVRSFFTAGTFSMLSQWIHHNCADDADHIRHLFVRCDQPHDELPPNEDMLARNNIQPE